MADSSADEDIDSHAANQNHSISERFAAFKKQLNRTNSSSGTTAFNNSNTTAAHSHENSETPIQHDKSGQSSSFSIFKTRFQPSFRSRTSSDAAAPAENNNHSHYNPNQAAPNHRNRLRQPGNGGGGGGGSSPTPPSQTSSHHSLQDRDASSSRAFDVLLNENRALKHETEVYKQSMEALSSEKDTACRQHSELHAKVSEMTTQLRLMTRRYQKMKSKNEEYKQHFQHTLSTRLSAQNDSIRHYHSQLLQIKEKYEILYNEYLAKNEIIKDWQLKYERLTTDFDEWAKQNGSHTATNEVTPTQLVQQCVEYENRCREKDESLAYLADIIQQLYHNSLPHISAHLQVPHSNGHPHPHHQHHPHHHHHHLRSHDDDEQHSTEREHEEDEEEGEEEEDEEDEEDNVSVLQMTQTLQTLPQRQSRGAQLLKGVQYLSVESNDMDGYTPPNSSYASVAEDDGDGDVDLEDEDIEELEEDEQAESSVVTEDEEEDDDDVDEQQMESMVLRHQQQQQHQQHHAHAQHPALYHHDQHQQDALKQVETLLPSILGSHRHGQGRGRGQGRSARVPLSRTGSMNEKHRKKPKKQKQKPQHQKSKQQDVRIKLTQYRHDSHANDDNDEDDDAKEMLNGDTAEELLVDSENEPQLQSQSQSRGSTCVVADYAQSNNLSVPHNKLTVRSLSDISLDSDGIDKRSEDELENQLHLTPLKLPPKIHIHSMSNASSQASETRMKPMYHQQHSHHSKASSSSPHASTPASLASTKSPISSMNGQHHHHHEVPVPQKKRRRSWTVTNLPDGQGSLIITTVGDPKMVAKNKMVVDADAKSNHSANGHSNAGAKHTPPTTTSATTMVRTPTKKETTTAANRMFVTPHKKITSKSQTSPSQQSTTSNSTAGRSGNTSDSATGTDVAPSPAPPPPHPYVLQTPSSQASPNRSTSTHHHTHTNHNTTGQQSQSQSDDNRSVSPIISNNISDQFSSPSPHPLSLQGSARAKKLSSMGSRPEYSVRDDDNDNDSHDVHHDVHDHESD